MGSVRRMYYGKRADELDYTVFGCHLGCHLLA
jgi:hypothetical protein